MVKQSATRAQQNDIRPVYALALQLGVFTSARLRQDTLASPSVVTVFTDFLNVHGEMAHKKRDRFSGGNEYKYTLTSAGKLQIRDELDRLNATAQEAPRPT